MQIGEIGEDMENFKISAIYFETYFKLIDLYFDNVMRDTANIYLRNSLPLALSKHQSYAASCIIIIYVKY